MPEELAGQVPFLVTVACLTVFTSTSSLPQISEQRGVCSLRLKLQMPMCGSQAQYARVCLHPLRPNPACKKNNLHRFPHIKLYGPTVVLIPKTRA